MRGGVAQGPQALCIDVSSSHRRQVQMQAQSQGQVSIRLLLCAPQAEQTIVGKSPITGRKRTASWLLPGLTVDDSQIITLKELCCCLKRLWKNSKGAGSWGPSREGHRRLGGGHKVQVC